jgi:adenylosuccinate lyase
MIERYSRPEMRALWSDEAKFQRWLDVELLALEAMERYGFVPEGTSTEVKSKAKVRVARALELEDIVKHDVIAFLSSITEDVGESARFLHRGMTSSDLLDTTFAMALRDSGRVILREIDTLLSSLKRRAYEYKYTLCIGRSHGIHAEPTTFGVKIASWYSEMLRRRAHFESALNTVSVGKIGGAVGTYHSVDPRIETEVLAALGLGVEEVPSQVIHRDRHAEFFSSLALVGSSLERIAVEIRHLHRTEVGEVEEGFSKGQKGSSAMPHKKNPIATENLTGIARLLRGYSISALENVALWHERDISHSSVERMIAPDACTLIDYALARMTRVIDDLVVHPARMMENLESSRGLIFSGTLLVRLSDTAITREAAYERIQSHALSTWKDGGSFEARVRADDLINKALGSEVLDEVFDMKRHLRHVDFLFDRAFSTREESLTANE